MIIQVSEEISKSLKDEVLQRLDALAAKLGTTAEYLWGLYVKQAHVHAFQLLMLSLFFVALAITLFIIARTCFAKHRKVKDKLDDYDYPRYGDGYAIGGGFFYAGSIAALIAFVVSASQILTPLLNPEYWAFQEILRQLK